MEPTNFASPHDVLGVGGDIGPTTAQVRNDPARFAAQQGRDDTLNPPAALSSSTTAGVESSSRLPDRASRTRGEDHDNNKNNHHNNNLEAARAVAAQTEIGNSHGRIPTRRDTQRQLAAVRASELPVGASRTAEGGCHDVVADGVPFLSHEKLLSPDEEDREQASRSAAAAGAGATAVGGKTETLGGSSSSNNYNNNSRVVPPELPPRTHGYDYAFYPNDGSSSGGSNSNNTAGGVGAGRTNTGRSSPGASLGSKVKGAFAQVHGASEIVRGNIRAAIDNAVGDEARQAEDEDILRQGQREYTTRKLDKGGRSDSFPG